MRFTAKILISTPFRKLLVLISTLLILSSVGFYLLELQPQGHADFLSAIWWAVVTLTTVGYGDLVPATTPGRLLGLLVMISGIGMVSTLTGNLASIIVENRAKRRKGLLKVKLSGHVIIIGWNSFAKNIVSTLQDAEILKNNDLVLVNSLAPEERDSLAFDLDMANRLHFVYGNPAHESVVHRASPATAQVIYILSQAGLSAADSDQQSLYAALTLRSLAPKVSIYSEVVLAENRDHLLRAGVNEIVPRGEVASMLLGRMGKTPSVWPFFQGLVGSRNHAGSLDYRRLTSDEQNMDWGELIQTSRGHDGSLPLALCHESKDLTLQDMLDEGSALDQFILELFTMSGQQTSLGQQGPSIVINPADDLQLEGYDGLLYLKAQATES
ncbi:potassium channel family protein [Desulfovibrio ferrophilus]|uniref:Ion transport 2 domain protein n=1 Tax=Desulfovibrio ferrophilus TaxID=241368 RepID=A0A2Z6B1W5_9BACT|nr:potassium channel family protein [Desulfovibrio ferrophilus]BBD09484.1 ion transport 2 domain protein [Desulfovibrio ferrophilus]